MNIQEEKQLYRDTLQKELLSGEHARNKIDQSLLRLEAEETADRIKGMKVLRIAILAGVLLLAGCAVAAGIVLRGNGSRIPFFGRTDNPSMQAQKEYYERHSDSLQDPIIGNAGEKLLTIENIAVHRDTVTVFYSTASENEDYKIGLSVNGGAERIPSRTEKAGDGTDRGYMASFLISPEVPESCTLTVQFRQEDGTLISENSYEMDLSQSEAGDSVILSGETVRIEGTYSEEPEPPYRPFHDHTVTIESVRIGQDGGCVTVSEEMLPQGPFLNENYTAWYKERDAAKDAYFAEHPDSTDLEWEGEGIRPFLESHPCPLTQEEISVLWSSYDEENPVSWDPFINFSVTDENGVSLQPRIAWINGGTAAGMVQNEIRFTPREGMREIRLIPMYYAGQTEIVRLMFEESKEAELEETRKLELVSFHINEQERTVTVSYRTAGTRILDSYAEFLLDKEGNPVYPNAANEEVKFGDAASGTITTQFQILDENWDLDQIGGYGQEWSIPFLDLEKMVKIRLGE